MKKSTLFSFVALAIFAVSCDKTQESFNNLQEQNDNLTQDEIEALALFYSGNHIPVEEATCSAQSLMEFLDSEKLTRSTPSRSISSMKPVTRARLTKSGEESDTEDTLAYVFNFGQDEGYAILSADRRTDKVFAIVPDGHLDLTEEVDENLFSTGLMVFYGNLAGTYDSQIEKAQANQDLLLSQALEKLQSMADVPATKAGNDDIQIEYGTPKYVTVIAPMIKVRWGQQEPYNYYTPMESGKHCPTGCGATAVAQLMSYWRYPASYNWDVMLPETCYETPETFQTISRLMSDVGTGLNTRYKLSGSSTFFEDVPGYLTNLGYNPGTYQAFNADEVQISLGNQRPVLIAGSSFKNDVYKKYLVFWEKYSYTYYEGGHAWLLDGLMMEMTPSYMIYNGKRIFLSYTNKLLVHCNYGWPEKGVDGYYDMSAFNINAGPVTRARTVTTGTEGIFQFNVECITNIYK